MEPDSTLSCSKELATEPSTQMNHTYTSDIALHHHWCHAWPLFLFCNSVQFISESTLINFRTYKVVQIWPGLIRLVYTQISPAHIWTTLYIVLYVTWGVHNTNNATWLHWLDRGSRSVEALGHTWIPPRSTAYPSWGKKSQPAGTVSFLVHGS